MDVATSIFSKTAMAAQPKRQTLKVLFRWLAVLLVIVALAASGWWYATRPVILAGAKVTRGPVADVVYATGFVEPRRPVDVSSRVTAPVTAVLADEGDHVSRGQALATLDAEDQRQTIAQLTASRINAEQDERRALALFQQGWATKETRDKAVATANSARALEAAGKARLNQYTIRSGISGIILRRDVEPGDLATSTKTLFEIGDPKLLRITATVDERDIPLVRTGSTVMMSTEAYPGRILHGAVYEITPGGDPDQRAFRVRIRPSDSSALPVGLTLEVNIMVAQRQRALLVPSGAIHNNIVWTVNHGRAWQVPVQVGIRATDRSEIRSGLSEDACVAIDPPAKLKNGQHVDIAGCR